MASCGVCMTRRRLVTAILDDSGEVVLVGASERSDHGRSEMLFALQGDPGFDSPFVVTESLLAADPLPRLAAARGARVLVAPDALVPAAVQISGRASTSPRTLATLLARMPASPPFAERLRPLRLQLALPLLV